MTNQTSTRVSQRLAALQPSATLAVDAKAKALKAAGEPVIGFGAGEPDFPTPAHIVDAAVAAARDPKNHKYTLAKGLAELRQAISDKTFADAGYRVDPEDIIVTNGGKQAVYQACVALIDPDDEVIIPAPYWTTYPEVVRLCAGTPVEVFSGAEHDYKITVDQLEAARTPRTKALILCSPSNPTGSVYSAEEVTAIGKWALETGVWVITDEIYQHLIYDGEMSYLLACVPELRDQTIVVNGVAKTYAMTGWRVGWMHGPSDVMKKVANFESHITSNVANVSQRAAIAALTGDQSVVEEMKVAFDRRRKTLVSMLREITGFTVPTPRGAFYVFAHVGDLLGWEIRGRQIQTSAELAELILDEAQVAVVPGEAFGAPEHLRFSYALGDDDLVTGAQRLQELFRTV
ncbi:pyridoxal phosphate-dependent aminotransferase [Trueperella sp. LYQ141]|uniref:pyridoxal phosphate-dependent aminotransferase n=1 Tax=Trueperella sp. LYQ141 TaxID=3391058 RepID=UPI003983B439